MTDTIARRDWRSVLFRLVAAPVVLLDLLLFEGLRAALEPFLGSGGDPSRWETVQYGMIAGVLLGGALLLCLPRPRQAVAAMQVFVATSAVLLVGELATQGPQLELVAIFAITTGVPWLAHPTPGAVLRLTGSHGASRAAVPVAVATALLGLAAFLLEPGIPAAAVAAALGSAAAVALVGGPGRGLAAALAAVALLTLAAGALHVRGEAPWLVLGTAAATLAVGWVSTARTRPTSSARRGVRAAMMRG